MDTRPASGATCIWALALAGLSCAAQAEELPRSNACQTALKALEDAEDAIAASAKAAGSRGGDQQRQRAVAARLQPMRLRVAEACLGGMTQSPPPSQRTWAAPSMPARPSVAAPRLPQIAVPSVTIPPPRFEPPVTITHCNGAACVASDGSTLTRVGPNLIGPRGSCQQQGVFVHCP